MFLWRTFRSGRWGLGWRLPFSLALALAVVLAPLWILWLACRAVAAAIRYVWLSMTRRRPCKPR